MKSLFLILLIGYMGQTYADGARAGNGGGTLFCQDGRSILLDYYEAEFNGIYTFHKLKKLSPEKRQRIFHDRISLYSPYMSKFLMKLREYFHQRVSYVDGIYFNIPDDFRSIIYEQSCELKLVAVQRIPFLPKEKVYFINNYLWQKMDSISQEGLINHEILYTIALNLEVENSRLVRQALAYLMADQFEYNREEFRREFYDKVTAGGFFSRFEDFNFILCPRLGVYGFSCNNI